MAEGEEDGQDASDEDDDVIKRQGEEEEATVAAAAQEPKVIVEHQPLPSIYELQHHDVTMTSSRTIHICT